MRKKTKKMKDRKESVWIWFVLAYVPILGGLIGYIMNEKRNTDLADMCLLFTVVNPFLLGFIMTDVLAILFPMMTIGAIELYSILTVIVLSFVFGIYVTKVSHKNNFYKDFIWVEFFTIIGGLYAYVKTYGKFKKFKKNVIFAMIGLYIVNLIVLSIANSILPY